jgi:hypothetical protein
MTTRRLDETLDQLVTLCTEAVQQVRNYGLGTGLDEVFAAPSPDRYEDLCRHLVHIWLEQDDEGIDWLLGHLLAARERRCGLIAPH